MLGSTPRSTSRFSPQHRIRQITCALDLRHSAECFLGTKTGEIWKINYRHPDNKHKYREHKAAISFLVYTHDYKRIISADRMGMIFTWDAKRFTKKSKLKFHLPNPVLQLVTKSSTSYCNKSIDSTGQIFFWQLINQPKKKNLKELCPDIDLSSVSIGTTTLVVFTQLEMPYVLNIVYITEWNLIKIDLRDFIEPNYQYKKLFAQILENKHPDVNRNNATNTSVGHLNVWISHILVLSKFKVILVFNDWIIFMFHVTKRKRLTLLHTMRQTEIKTLKVNILQNKLGVLASNRQLYLFNFEIGKKKLKLMVKIPIASNVFFFSKCGEKIIYFDQQSLWLRSVKWNGDKIEITKSDHKRTDESEIEIRNLQDFQVSHDRNRKKLQKTARKKNQKSLDKIRVEHIHREEGKREKKYLGERKKRDRSGSGRGLKKGKKKKERKKDRKDKKKKRRKSRFSQRSGSQGSILKDKKKNSGYLKHSQKGSKRSIQMCKKTANNHDHKSIKKPQELRQRQEKPSHRSRKELIDSDKHKKKSRRNSKKNSRTKGQKERSIKKSRRKFSKNSKGTDSGVSYNTSEFYSEMRSGSRSVDTMLELENSNYSKWGQVYRRSARLAKKAMSQKLDHSFRDSESPIQFRRQRGSVKNPSHIYKTPGSKNHKTNFEKSAAKSMNLNSEHSNILNQEHSDKIRKKKFSGKKQVKPESSESKEMTLSLKNHRNGMYSLAKDDQEKQNIENKILIPKSNKKNKKKFSILPKSSKTPKNENLIKKMKNHKKSQKLKKYSEKKRSVRKHQSQKKRSLNINHKSFQSHGNPEENSNDHVRLASHAANREFTSESKFSKTPSRSYIEIISQISKINSPMRRKLNLEFEENKNSSRMAQKNKRIFSEKKSQKDPSAYKTRDKNKNHNKKLSQKKSHKSPRFIKRQKQKSEIKNKNEIKIDSSDPSGEFSNFIIKLPSKDSEGLNKSQIGEEFSFSQKSTKFRPNIEERLINSHYTRSNKNRKKTDERKIVSSRKTNTHAQSPSPRPDQPQIMNRDFKKSKHAQPNSRSKTQTRDPTKNPVTNMNILKLLDQDIVKIDKETRIHKKEERQYAFKSKLVKLGKSFNDQQMRKNKMDFVNYIFFQKILKKINELNKSKKIKKQNRVGSLVEFVKTLLYKEKGHKTSGSKKKKRMISSKKREQRESSAVQPKSRIQNQVTGDKSPIDLSNKISNTHQPQPNQNPRGYPNRPQQRLLNESLLKLETSPNSHLPMNIPHFQSFQNHPRNENMHLSHLNPSQAHHTSFQAQHQPSKFRSHLPYQQYLVYGQNSPQNMIYRNNDHSMSLKILGQRHPMSNNQSFNGSLYGHFGHNLGNSNQAHGPNHSLNQSLMHYYQSNSQINTQIAQKAPLDQMNMIQGFQHPQYTPRMNPRSQNHLMAYPSLQANKNVIKNEAIQHKEIGNVQGNVLENRPVGGNGQDENQQKKNVKKQQISGQEIVSNRKIKSSSKINFLDQKSVSPKKYSESQRKKRAKPKNKNKNEKEKQIVVSTSIDMEKSKKIQIQIQTQILKIKKNQPKSHKKTSQDKIREGDPTERAAQQSDTQEDLEKFTILFEKLQNTEELTKFLNSKSFPAIERMIQEKIQRKASKLQQKFKTKNSLWTNRLQSWMMRCPLPVAKMLNNRLGKRPHDFGQFKDEKKKSKKKSSSKKVKRGKDDRKSLVKKTNDSKKGNHRSPVRDYK